MKLDIVRAWKDENYRGTLSEEQVDALPANPVGDLELKAVYGGGGVSPAAAIAPVGVGVGAASAGVAALSSNFLHSFAVSCEDNFFSNVFQRGININSETQVHCQNRSNNEREDDDR